MVRASQKSKSIPLWLQRAIDEGKAHAKISAKPLKYRNEPTCADGLRFDSKREARFYDQLKTLRAAGEVDYFLTQVPIRLPGGVRYVVDFQVFMSDGRVRYVDVKGFETATFRLKKKQVEALYPITIEVVR